MESPESGLAVYIKELLPNGGKVELSCLSKVLTEGRPPGEGVESEGPYFGGFLKSSWRKPKDFCRVGKRVG